MPLPLARPSPPTASYLYSRTQLDWARHLADETTLDVGVAFTSKTFATLHDANRMIDAALPPGADQDAALDAVDAHFAGQGTRCLRCTLNPSVDAARTAPLIEALLRRGYRPWTQALMRLDHASLPPSEIDDIAILPARSAYAAALTLAEKSAAAAHIPQLAPAFETHLDDARYDVLLALDTSMTPRDAVARAGLLVVGDAGLIGQVFVTPTHRRRGIARLLVSRLTDLAARAGLRHVILTHEVDSDHAHALYSQSGFIDAGTVTQYLRNP